MPIKFEYVRHERLLQNTEEGFINGKWKNAHMVKHLIIAFRGRGIGRTYTYEGVKYVIYSVMLSPNKMVAVLNEISEMEI